MEWKHKWLQSNGILDDKPTQTIQYKIPPDCYRCSLCLYFQDRVVVELCPRFPPILHLLTIMWTKEVSVQANGPEQLCTTVYSPSHVQYLNPPSNCILTTFCDTLFHIYSIFYQKLLFRIVPFIFNYVCNSGIQHFLVHLYSHYSDQNRILLQQEPFFKIHATQYSQASLFPPKAAQWDIITPKMTF